MAEKVAVDADGTPEGEPIKRKKKRSKCCTCCIVVLVIFLVILGAAFGVGYYLGDKFTKENFNMPLSDVFGVLSDLYWTDDKDVVKNPYKQSDLDGFYSEIKRNMLLKEDAEIDFNAALDAAIDNFLGSDGGKALACKLAAKSDGEADGEAGDETGGESGDGESSDDSAIMNILIDMVADALTLENIDLERLNQYDDSDPSSDTYRLDLKDKQLAAFINAVLERVLLNADRLDGLSEYASFINLPKSVKLKQISFHAQSGTNEAGETVVVSTSADVTVWVGLQSAAGQAIKHFMKQGGVGWAGGIASWLGDVILPENLYATITIPLYGEGDTQLRLNAMNKKERDRAYKLVNGVLGMTGSDQTVTDMLNGVTESLKPALEKMSELIPLDSVTDGALKVDLLGTVVGMASDGMEGVNLTKSDLLYVLQAFLSDPAEQYAAIEPYRYDNRYLVDGEEVLIEGDAQGKEKINYEQRFIDAICEKYSLDLGEQSSLTEVLAMFGVSLDGSNTEMGSTDILGLINAQRFNANLDEDIANLKLNVTDRMLAAALDKQMASLLSGQDGALGDITLKLEALTFVKDPTKPADNLYAQIAASVVLDDLLGSMTDGTITKLVNGLLPPKLLFTIWVDITPNRAEGVAKDEVRFKLNSYDNTDRALGVVKNIVPDLDLDAMSAQIDEMLNGMLDQMYASLDIRLVASTMERDASTGKWTGDLAAMQLPDIFTVVTDLVLVEEAGKPETRVIEPAELKNILKGLNDVEGFGGEALGDDYSGFIEEVMSKYYLDGGGNEIKTFEQLTALMTGGFTMDKFITEGNSGLKHDTRTTAQLKPVMTSDQLGALLITQLSGAGSGLDMSKYSFVDVQTGDGTLTAVLSISVADLLPEDVRFLLTSDKLYITAEVEMDDPIGDGSQADPMRYPVTLSVNNMNGDDYAATLKLVRFFSKDFDIEAQVRDIGVTLYDKMTELNGSLSSDGSSSVRMFTFTADGLEMPDFYTFLATKMRPSVLEKANADDVKRALQGMFERGDTANPYNYVAADIQYNAGESVAPSYADMNKDMSDVKFNGYMNTAVRSTLSSKDDTISAVQTVILAAGMDPTVTYNGKAVKLRDLLGEKLGATLDARGEYIAVMFKMNMDSFLNCDDNSVKDLLPHEIYATAVYSKTRTDGKDVFSVVGESGSVIFNDLDAAAYGVMIELMDLSPDANDPDKLNINTIVAEGAKVLNNLATAGTIEFKSQVDNEGIGGLKIASNFGI